MTDYIVHGGKAGREFRLSGPAFHLAMRRVEERRARRARMSQTLYQPALRLVAYALIFLATVGALAWLS